LLDFVSVGGFVGLGLCLLLHGLALGRAALD